jgi:hypothetical protein
MSNYFTEEKLLKIKSVSRSVKYGLKLILKYPEKFKLDVYDIRHAIYYEESFIDEIENSTDEEISILKNIIKNHGGITVRSDFNRRFLLGIEIESMRKEVNKTFKEILISFVDNALRNFVVDYENLASLIQYLMCSYEVSKHKIGPLNIYDLSERALDRVLEIQKRSIKHLVLEKYFKFDEEFYMNNYEYISLKEIDIKNNPWANPWTASDDLRLFVILNKIE